MGSQSRVSTFYWFIFSLPNPASDPVSGNVPPCVPCVLLWPVSSGDYTFPTSPIRRIQDPQTLQPPCGPCCPFHPLAIFRRKKPDIAHIAPNSTSPGNGKNAPHPAPRIPHPASRIPHPTSTTVPYSRGFYTFPTFSLYPSAPSHPSRFACSRAHPEPLAHFPMPQAVQLPIAPPSPQREITL